MADKIFWIDLACQIFEYLTLSGETIETLSEKSGVPQYYVRKLLSAHSIETKRWRPICLVAGVSVDEALAGVEDNTYKQICKATYCGNVDELFRLCEPLKPYQRARYLCWAAWENGAGSEALGEILKNSISYSAYGIPKRSFRTYHLGYHRKKFIKGESSLLSSLPLLKCHPTDGAPGLGANLTDSESSEDMERAEKRVKDSRMGKKK